MSRNLYEPTPERRISQNRWGIKDTRQRPLAGKWYTPDCDETEEDEAALGCDGDEPPLENGFAQPAPPLELFSFRKHADGSLEFKGHLDAQGAASGDVAVTLPGAVDGDLDMLPANDQDWHTTIRTAPGTGPTAFTLALVLIDATTGEVTLWWPAVG